ncbi:hypothetical protein EBS43_01035 [bacterium]|jgi:flagellar basal body-associated protein FliL|nr:hypothetical protein [bacterium]
MTKLKLNLKFSLPYYLNILEMLRSLKSPDPETRKITFIYLLSLIGLFSVLGLSGTLFVGKIQRDQALEAQRKAQIELERLKAETEAQSGDFVVDLGTITIDLKPIEPTTTSVGIKNVAQLNIHLRCDTVKAKNLIQEKTPQIKEMILDLLIGIDREDLLSYSAKRRLKSLMMQKINAWLPYGKIEDVLLSDLLFV